MAADADLATRLRQHGAAGLAVVYTAYADRLYGYAITITRDRDLAADAVHDTFLVAVDRIGQLRDPDKLRPWLFAITRNECLRRLRDRNRFDVGPQSWEVLDAMGDEPDLTAGISRSEAADMVQTALTGLSPSDRDVLTLALGADLDASAVGTVLGLDSNAVHARLSRARDALAASVTALVLARTKGRDCAELATILQDHPRFDPLLRKRINRHIKQCDSCDRRGRAAALACAPALAAPVIALSAPAGLSESLFGPHGSTHDPHQIAAAGARSGPFTPDGFPVPLSVNDPVTAAPPVPPPGTPRGDGNRRKAMLAGAVGVGLLVLGLVAWTARDEPASTTPVLSPATAESPLPPTAFDTDEAVPPPPDSPNTSTTGPGNGDAGNPDSKGQDTANPDTNAPSKGDSDKDADGKPSDQTPAADDPEPPAQAESPEDAVAEDPGAVDSGQGDSTGTDTSGKKKKKKDNKPSDPRPAPTPQPTPAPAPKPAPAPSAPRITALSVLDLDKADDGSFTRCDAFRMSVSATAAGQVTAATADYGAGSFPLGRDGTRWRGVTTLPPGEYTVRVRLVGPGGSVERQSSTLLHICPG